jgi:hypothetical protein
VFPYLPTFNLTSRVWRPPHEPPGEPTFITPSQLYIASRGLIDIQPGQDHLWQPPIYLRVPKTTFLRRNDVVEVEEGDGYFYRVRWAEKVHRGFPNEYVTAIMEQLTDAPVPPIEGFLLVEDGTSLLLEDGTEFLLEG